MSLPAGPPASGEAVDLLRLLVDSVRDYAILLLDPEGRVTSWSAAAQRIKGYRAAEIIGQHFSRFYPQEAIDRGWPEHELAVAKREGRFEDEGWRVRQDGSRFWANVVITALRSSDGELRGFGKVTRDLTERRRHEEMLRQSEERLRLLVESVQDYAIFMLDPQGRVASWNPGAQRIKGWRADEILGQHFSRFYPPDAVARGWPEHELAVAGRDGRFEDEGWRLRKDGSRFWANVVITAMRGTEGQLRGFAKVTRDLTERRQVEQLQEEGRRLRHFLAMLGHELRNPLTPISAAVALMGNPDADRRTLARAREIVERQVGHLTRLLDDLLDVGRVISDKIAVSPEALDLGALVMGVAESMRPLFDGKRQDLALTLPPRPVRVAADPTRLAQIVSNLLTNANRYTQEGGHVRVQVRRQERFAEVSVADDGRGLAPELLARIFEPFVQGDRDLARTEGGLGIGLTLVHRLVELHDGTVTASSPGPGRGSTFLVRLPVLSTPEEDAAERSPAAEGRAGGLRVLVVDDNHDSAEAIGLLLALWGHDVESATDGPSGLEKAARWRPDAILLDIGLPGMSGYEVAERLKGKGPVLIAMTGYGQPEDVERAHEAGFDEHLVKPVSPETLDRVLALIPLRRA